MKNTKKVSRLRRARKTRYAIQELGKTRLTVFRSCKHIYAQLFSGDGATVLATASTLEAPLRQGATGNKEAAAQVGAIIAERALAAGITEVAFDRSGFKYHGRIKALAEAAREKGLKF